MLLNKVILIAHNFFLLNPVFQLNFKPSIFLYFLFGFIVSSMYHQAACTIAWEMKR
uniref:Uncharacterized protein n=1 Tax=Arundo donax TaxID=35708 RepID=A0A0A9BFE7_ARUDO